MNETFEPFRWVDELSAKKIRPRAEPGEPASPELLDAARNIPGISDAALDLYRAHDGYRVWADTKKFTSSVGFLPLERLLSGWLAKELIQAHEEICWFDEFEPEGTDLRAAGWDADGRIWFYNDELHPLDLDFAGYLESMAAARGHVHWRYARAVARGAAEHRDSREVLIEQMGKVFPEQDLAPFLETTFEMKVVRVSPSHERLEELPWTEAGFETIAKEAKLSGTLDDLDSELRQTRKKTLLPKRFKKLSIHASGLSYARAAELVRDDLLARAGLQEDKTLLIELEARSAGPRQYPLKTLKSQAMLYRILWYLDPHHPIRSKANHHKVWLGWTPPSKIRDSCAISAKISKKTAKVFARIPKEWAEGFFEEGMQFETVAREVDFRDPYRA